MPLAISAAPSSGAATPDPPVTAGLQLWYEANTTDGSNGQPVTAWPDKSGLGRTLSALDPSQAATMRRNAINGRAALEFNGTSSLLKTYNSTFTIGQPDTLYFSSSHPVTACRSALLSAPLYTRISATSE